MTQDDLNVDAQTELLARMWIECDPNRGPPEPDRVEPLGTDANGLPEMHPRWHWFLPRARASLEYFAERGFTLNGVPHDQAQG